MSKWISDGDWVYEVNTNHKGCTIREYKGKQKDIVVPEYCSGYPVTSFGNEVSSVFCFPDVQTVSFPSTITEITSCAFLCCFKLEEISLPANLISLGNNAFYGCKSLKEITLPNRISYVQCRTFGCCESLVSLVIPSGVKEIKPLSFLGCSRLQQVMFYEGLEIIGSGAFKLTNLSEVILPDSIVRVEPDSFDDKVTVRSK